MFNKNVHISNFCRHFGNDGNSDLTKILFYSVRHFVLFSKTFYLGQKNCTMVVFSHI